MDGPFRPSLSVTGPGPAPPPHPEELAIASVSKGEARSVYLGLMVRDARRCRAPHHEGLDLPNPFDEQVDHRPRHPVGLAFRHAPAREMAVDLHPREAIDQGTAGDQDGLE